MACLQCGTSQRSEFTLCESCIALNKARHEARVEEYGSGRLPNKGILRNQPLSTWILVLAITIPLLYVGLKVMGVFNPNYMPQFNLNSDLVTRGDPCSQLPRCIVIYDIWSPFHQKSASAIQDFRIRLAKYPLIGLKIIVDSLEKPEAIHANDFANEISGEVYTDPRHEFKAAFAVYAFPKAYVIDSSGRILASHAGIEACRGPTEESFNLYMRKYLQLGDFMR